MYPLAAGAQEPAPEPLPEIQAQPASGSAYAGQGPANHSGCGYADGCYAPPPCAPQTASYGSPCCCEECDDDDDHCHDSTCNMYPHYPYYPAFHGYYYYRPYNYIHVLAHMENPVGGTRRNPYSTALFEDFYAELPAAYEETPAPEIEAPAPEEEEALPDLEGLLN